MRPLELIGQGNRLVNLMRSVEAGRIVHALLLEGPQGTGKRTAASWIAQALVCTSPDRPCGVCPACKKQQVGLHPDIHVLSLEKNKRQIPVDAIRELIGRISVKPFEASWHIAVIQPADAMNASAQNALLKTLETPPGNTVFLLITSSAEGLLPTILSRCQRVRFTPLSVEACAGELERRGLPPGRARQLAGCAQGAVGRALALDGDEGALALRESVLRSIGALHKKEDVAYAASVLSDIKGSEMDALGWMELWARDRMAVAAGAEPYETEDRARLESSALDGRALLRMLPEARRRVAVNVRWTYVLESLYLALVTGASHL